MSADRNCQLETAGCPGSKRTKLTPESSSPMSQFDGSDGDSAVDALGRELNLVPLLQVVQHLVVCNLGDHAVSEAEMRRRLAHSLILAPTMRPVLPGRFAGLLQEPLVPAGGGPAASWLLRQADSHGTRLVSARTRKVWSRRLAPAHYLPLSDSCIT